MDTTKIVKHTHCFCCKAPLHVTHNLPDGSTFAACKNDIVNITINNIFFSHTYLKYGENFRMNLCSAKNINMSYNLLFSKNKWTIMKDFDLTVSIGDENSSIEDLISVFQTLNLFN